MKVEFGKTARVLSLLAAVLGVTFAAAVGLLRRQAADEAKNLIALRIIDGMELLRNADHDMATVLRTYEQGALAKCRALAFCMALRRENGKEIDARFLGEVARAFGIVEYHVSDGRGILEFSSQPEVIGYDMASAPQSREFMPALTCPGFEYVQLPRARGLDGRLIQYIGVARRDRPGIVQIGYHPAAYTDIRSVSSIERRMQSLRIGEGGCMLVAKDGVVAAAEDATQVGHRLSDLGMGALPEEGAFFPLAVHGVRCLASYENCAGFQLVGVLPESEVYRQADTCRAILLVSFVLVLILVWRLALRGPRGQ